VRSRAHCRKISATKHVRGTCVHSKTDGDDIDSPCAARVSVSVFAVIRNSKPDGLPESSSRFGLPDLFLWRVVARSRADTKSVYLSIRSFSCFWIQERTSFVNRVVTGGIKNSAQVYYFHLRTQSITERRGHNYL